MGRKEIHLWLEADIKERLDLAYKNRHLITNFEGRAYSSKTRFYNRLFQLALDSLKGRSDG